MYYSTIQHILGWNIDYVAHVPFVVLLGHWRHDVLRFFKSVLLCFIGNIDANQTLTYVWKHWSDISSYNVNHFKTVYVILFSIETLNIQRSCKWKNIEWFILVIKCTFQSTSKGVSQALNLQKGIKIRKKRIFKSKSKLHTHITIFMVTIKIHLLTWIGFFISVFVHFYA